MFLVYCIVTLRKTYTDESDLKVAALDKMTVKSLTENMQIIHKLRRDYWLNLFMTLLDLVICMNECNITLKILGKRINHGCEGGFGMVSALVFNYLLFKHKR